MSTNKKSTKRERAGAERAETASLPQRMQSYFVLHGQTCVAALGRLYRAPFASGMTIVVIALALALPAGLQVLVKNVRQASEGLELSYRISLFLRPELSDEVGRKLTEKLVKHPGIAEAQLIGKEAGLREFQSYSGFGEALKALDYNPLPAVVSILPKDALTSPDSIERLIGELKTFAEVDVVQADMDWLRKLHALLAIAQRSAVSLSILLSLAVLFIVGNTIRLELQYRHEEIAVTRLMGATDRFICRPFLYAGMWYGLLAGVLAWLLVSFVLLLLKGPVRDLSLLYGGHFELLFLSLKESGCLIALATTLGAGGAWSVARYHLRRLEPSH